MNELATIPEIRKSIPRALQTRFADDFEALYQKLPSTSKEDVEVAIQGYFRRLKLPKRATVYDQLLLSLREKDLVASFNWDPFLYQAWSRNCAIAPMPMMVFLHGNISVRYCGTHAYAGSGRNDCPKCGKRLEPVKLLYPFGQKDYQEGFIRGQWNTLKKAIEAAYMLTIFGYRAPESDVEAIRMLEAAYAVNEARELAEINIVDVRPRRELRRQWARFTVGSHYGIARRFRQTLLAKTPRRSTEFLAQGTLACDPWDYNPLPRYRSLSRLQTWIEPLVAEEQMNRLSGRTCDALREEFHLPEP